MRGGHALRLALPVKLRRQIEADSRLDCCPGHRGMLRPITAPSSQGFSASIFILCKGGYPSYIRRPRNAALIRWLNHRPGLAKVSGPFPESLAGMAGFEPAVAESKSAALPLGYTPMLRGDDQLAAQRTILGVVVRVTPFEPLMATDGALVRSDLAVFRLIGLTRHFSLPLFIGAGGRIRTPDLSITKALLYQLSYTSMWSEWRDSNSRPHGPKPCALSLSYTRI